MVQGVSQIEKAQSPQASNLTTKERSVLVAPVRWLRTSKTMTCPREKGRVWSLKSMPSALSSRRDAFTAIYVVSA